MDVVKRCKRCGVSYNELHNFGKLSCRMHPMGYGVGGYACCGKDYAMWRRTSYADAGFSTPTEPSLRRIPGCVPCDHGEGDDILNGTSLRNVTLGELWESLRQHHSKEKVESYMMDLINRLFPNQSVTDTTMLVRVQGQILDK